MSTFNLSVHPPILPQRLVGLNTTRLKARQSVVRARVYVYVCQKEEEHPRRSDIVLDDREKIYFTPERTSVSSRIILSEDRRGTSVVSDIRFPGVIRAVSSNTLRLSPSRRVSRVVSYLAPFPSPRQRRILEAGNVPAQWRLTGCTWDNRSPG